VLCFRPLVLATHALNRAGLFSVKTRTQPNHYENVSLSLSFKVLENVENEMFDFKKNTLFSGQHCLDTIT